MLVRTMQSGPLLTVVYIRATKLVRRHPIPSTKPTAYIGELSFELDPCLSLAVRYDQGSRKT